MREILFRGKTSQTKWVYGDIVQEDELTYIRENKNTADNYYYKNYIVYMDSLSQYTGIDDKNGVKVFESDILKVRDSLPGGEMEFIGVVEFRDGSFVIVNDEMTHYRWIDYEIEVIGNKFDNPELLEA